MGYFRPISSECHSLFWVTEPFKNLMKVLDVLTGKLYIYKPYIVHFAHKFRMDTKGSPSLICQVKNSFLYLPSVKEDTGFGGSQNILKK